MINELYALQERANLCHEADVIGKRLLALLLSFSLFSPLSSAPMNLYRDLKFVKRIFPRKIFPKHLASPETVQENDFMGEWVASLERLPDGISKNPSHIHFVGGQKNKSVYVFDRHPGGDLSFTPEERHVMFQLLESLGRTSVNLPRWIATSRIDDPIYGLRRGGAFATGDGGIAFPTYPNSTSPEKRFFTHHISGGQTVMVRAVTKWRGFAGYFLHELGHHIRWGLEDDVLKEWLALHGEGKHDQGSKAIKNNHAAGYLGNKSEHEDFATTVGALINTEPFLYDVLTRAEKGYLLVLQKALFAMSLLIKNDPEGHYLDTYYYDDPYDDFKDSNPVLKITRVKIILTADSFIIPGFEFALEKREEKTVIVAVKALNKFKGLKILERDFRANPVEVPETLLERLRGSSRSSHCALRLSEN